MQHVHNKYYNSLFNNTILLNDETKTININSIYRFINYSKITDFFIIKENCYLQNEYRIKVLLSNIYFESNDYLNVKIIFYEND